MIKKLNTITPVNPERTVVFYSPIEGDDILVRTGVPNNHSFFHSILRSTFPAYSDLSDVNKEKVVLNLKKKLSKINKNNDVYNRILSNTIEYAISNLYYFFNDDERSKGKLTGEILKKTVDNENELQYYKFLTHLVSNDVFLNTIIKNNFDVNTTTNDLTDYFYNVNEIKNLSNAKKEIFKTLIGKLTRNIIKLSNVYSKEHYLEYIKNTQVVDEFIINLVRLYIDKNIYILDSKTRLPEKKYKHLVEQHKQSIIIMKIVTNNQTIYEPVGKLITNSTICRTFKENDIINHTLYNKINLKNYNKDDNYFNINEHSFQIESNKDDFVDNKDGDDDDNDKYEYNRKNDDEDKDGDNIEHYIEGEDEDEDKDGDNIEHYIEGEDDDEDEDGDNRNNDDEDEDGDNRNNDDGDSVINGKDDESDDDEYDELYKNFLQ